MQSISIHTAQTKPQWLIDLAEAFNDPVKLLTFLELNPADFEQAILARKLFPLRVPRSFAERMEKASDVGRARVFTSGRVYARSA